MFFLIKYGSAVKNDRSGYTSVTLQIQYLRVNPKREVAETTDEKKLQSNLSNTADTYGFSKMCSSYKLFAAKKFSLFGI